MQVICTARRCLQVGTDGHMRSTVIPMYKKVAVCIAAVCMYMLHSYINTCVEISNYGNPRNMVILLKFARNKYHARYF